MNGVNKRPVLPKEPVTLSVDQIGELNRELSKMRHDIANYMTVIIAAAELAAKSPEKARPHMELLLAQSPKITEAVKQFSAVFERMLGITRQ